MNDAAGTGRARRHRLGYAAGGLVAAGALGVAVFAAAWPASAATQAASQAAGAPTQVTASGAPTGTPPQRSDETVLTGTQAEQATAAALKAVPGATVIRVETDADGDAYEAHLKKADGSLATVKFDKNFTVLRVESGMGATKGGHGGPGGAAPRGAPPSGK